MFAGFDVVLLSNLSSLALTDAEMRALRDFVRDRGGGLVMLGGERSFGLGGVLRHAGRGSASGQDGGPAQARCAHPPPSCWSSIDLGA